MDKFLNNKGIFFGISSLNVLNSTITKASEVKIKVTIDTETPVEINLPMSYNDFKNLNTEACKDFDLTEEDYIRHYVCKHLKESSSRLLFSLVYCAIYKKNGENNYTFNTKDEKNYTIINDHFYIENLMQIVDSYKQGLKKTKTNLANYIKYLLHPMDTHEEKSYYNWSNNTRSGIKYQGCYYQLQPFCPYIKREITPDTILACNNFDMIPFEKRAVKVELDDNFFAADMKLYTVKYKNIFEKTPNEELKYKTTIKKEAKTEVTNEIELKQDEQFNYLLSISVEEDIKEKDIDEIANKFKEIVKFCFENELANSSVNKEEKIKDKKKEIEENRKKLQELINEFNTLEKTNGVYEHICKYLKGNKFKLDNSNESEKPFYFNFADYEEDIKKTISVNVIKGVICKDDKNIEEDCIKNIINNYINDKKDELIKSINIEDIADYKNEKEKFENKCLFENLKHNILHETKFNINMLKENFSNNKITQEQYNELKNLYIGSVLDELDVIGKNLDKAKESDIKETEGGEIQVDNGPTDTIDKKIENIAELADEDTVKKIKEKVEGLKKKLEDKKEFKKYFGGKNIFDNLDKTVSDIIKEIDEAKNKQIKVTLKFTTGDKCKFKDEYKNLSTYNESFEFADFNELINKIKTLTGDSKKNVFTIKNGNNIIVNKLGINDNDTLTILLGEESNAVICEKPKTDQDKQKQDQQINSNEGKEEKEKKEKQKGCCNSGKGNK